MMNNKFKYFVAAALLSTVSFSFAQVRIVNNTSNTAVNNMSAFIDASSNSTANGNANVGKGLVFPRTDLTTFTAFGGSPIGIATSFPTRYDGMVVYNTAASGVAGVGATQGTLSQGFWFYDNKSTTTNGGTWRPIIGQGGAGKVNILPTETITNTLVNNSQIYAIKGTFNANGTSTAPVSYTNAVIIPAAGSLYSITIYQAGTNNVYSNSVYSYDKATGNLITGSPSISVVYPSGNYDYVVEYTKL